MISFDEFKKLDLRVAKVIEAEKIEGSKNLLRLEIDLGSEKRQIVAGISQFYQPEDLVGKEIVVVANLEPKKLMGVESQGMLLAADIDGEPVILVPEKEVPPGTTIR
jgi:methionine--tRNA ligase beta chain